MKEEKGVPPDVAAALAQWRSILVHLRHHLRQILG